MEGKEEEREEMEETGKTTWFPFRSFFQNPGYTPLPNDIPD